MFFFFKQKTAYEFRISDWSSDVCSSDLPARLLACRLIELELQHAREEIARVGRVAGDVEFGARVERVRRPFARRDDALILRAQLGPRRVVIGGLDRSEVHTDELQSLMRISYAVFCWNKKNKHTTET